MDNSVVKKQAAKPKKTPAQQALELKHQGQSGPEIWDGNNAGWTLVSYSRKKNKK